MRSSLPLTIEIHEYLESDEHVLADATQIHQIVMNLCTNAAHAMENGGGILEVALTEYHLGEDHNELPPDLKSGPYVILSVGDSGDGMSPEILKQIFNPYFTTKETGQGTGLGLSVVHGIVKKCGGEITVKSEPGTGSVFNVYLPVLGQPPQIEVEIYETPQKGTETILVVDDEPMLLVVFKEQLEKLGYTVDAVNNGPRALELFKSDPDKYDLVITDMTMPLMTGEKLASEIFNIRQDIPIILCTGHSQQLTEEKALNIGIRAFVMKPIKMNLLSQTVRRVLA
jgi:CheY-like chemotaxis protein